MTVFELAIPLQYVSMCTVLYCRHGTWVLVLRHTGFPLYTFSRGGTTWNWKTFGGGATYRVIVMFLLANKFRWGQDSSKGGWDWVGECPPKWNPELLHAYKYMQGCGNSEPIARHLSLFSTLLSCSLYTLYTAQF